MKWLKAVVSGAVLVCAAIGFLLPVLASGDASQVEGTLEAVDTVNRTVTVNGQTYSVGAQVIVEVGDSHIPFDQLEQYIGKAIELKLNDTNVVFKIEVKDGTVGNGAEHDFKGTLNAVDATNKTITVGNQSFPVSNHALLKIDNVGLVSLDDLAQYIGRFVEVKLDASKIVIKLEVSDGTSGDDHLNGGSDDDDFNGGDGDDTINGGPGNDHEDGGNGDDDLNGEDGDDILNGGSGNDDISGGSGQDGLSGNDGNDKIKGGIGDDDENGGNGNDDLDGEDGDDMIDGGSGNDDLDGGDGDDNLNGGDGNDNIKGGSGDDELNGDDDQPTVNAPAMAFSPIPAAVKKSKKGNDILDGGEGDDTIRGDSGNDQIVGGLGKDTINAGEGNDQVWISAGDVPAGQTENIDCGAGRDKVNLSNFPKKTKAVNGQIIDPNTGGTYAFVNCEKWVVSRTSPPKSVQASTMAFAPAHSDNARLTVFTLSGKKVLEREGTFNTMDDALSEKSTGETIVNGVYFVVLTIHEGALSKNQIQKLVILK